MALAGPDAFGLVLDKFSGFDFAAEIQARRFHDFSRPFPGAFVGFKKPRACPLIWKIRAFSKTRLFFFFPSPAGDFGGLFARPPWNDR